MDFITHHHNGHAHDENQYHERSDMSKIEESGSNPNPNSLDTPMHKKAFELTEDDKIEQIADHFGRIMHILGLDLQDDSLKGTPLRVAKMYVQEIFFGLDPANKPVATLFDNKFGYKNMLIEKNIKVQSFCEHHFLPITGIAHIAYIPNGKVIGLSKLNRIVEYFSRRPQVQERLTMQMANELKRVLKTEDVAVYIDAKHMCVEARGVEHQGCTTITSEYGGKFSNGNVKNEFISAIRN